MDFLRFLLSMDITSQSGQQKNIAATEITIGLISTIGFIFMIIGFIFVVLGRLFLNSFWGKNIYDYGEVKDSYKLVKENVYHLCRHPIYFGQICMCVGTAFIVNNVYILLASILMIFINICRAYREDKYLKEYFKQEWNEYKDQCH